ncbi:hypothetical protein DM02DRAFT_713916 [Periconia macrospinosa]|uniref:Rhodopsin domain-containing protein n=1 Tax=Periconia macrospinosa TaxID=97972 RepID=A0A2V1EF68_9PLEO|nr:hypothetical protein DM02DRAFT_713916 [Periconia macrospinosa]
MAPQSVISLYVTSILFTSLALFMVVARLYTRIRILKHTGVEDYLISISMAASIGHLVLVTFQIKYGLGTSLHTIKPSDLMKFGKTLWATVPIYHLALLFVKLSIVCQYMRIFRGVMFQRTCKILLGVLAIYGCSTVFGSIFMCIPVQFFWGVGKGSCLNKLAFSFSNAALNIATDIFVFAMPIPLIKSLNMSKKKKIALGVVLGLGGIEVNVGIACSSITTLKPLVRKTFPKFLSSTNRLDDYGPHNHSESHNMKSLQKNTQKSDIQVWHTVQVNAENYNASREGSERGLIVSTTDCYSTNGTKPVRGDGKAQT